MERFPGIVFRDGPVGRRPGLAAGPDVWELAMIQRSGEMTDEEAIAWCAENLRLSAGNARVAFAYFAAYPDEIDAWVRRNDAGADEAEAAWLRDQPARA